MVLKEDIPLLGTVDDMATREKKRRVDSHPHRWTVENARKNIFTKGYAVGSDYVTENLAKTSSTPARVSDQCFFSADQFTSLSQNSLSHVFSDQGLNFYSLAVVDLMHEFELGVWPDIFKHLLRILYASDPSQVKELNERYRVIAPFGRDTIRKFPKDVSAMKKLAARDWEDMLQVCWCSRLKAVSDACIVRNASLRWPFP
jgi:hypothetical protein